MEVPIKSVNNFVTFFDVQHYEMFINLFENYKHAPLKRSQHVY